MKNLLKKALLSLGLIAALTACGGKNNEEIDIANYPSQDIRIIVAYRAGGGTDIGARVLTRDAAKEFDKPLVILNRPGADGQLGFTELANARPDGHTIGFINLPNFVSLSLTRNTSYTKDSVIPIINYVYDQGVLVVRGDSHIKTLEDFINEAKSRPGEITMSNNGTGASNHIGAATLEQKSGISLRHIPFGGTSDMLAALRGGHVEATTAKISEVTNLVNSGELRILASFTEERLEAFPEIPTLTEKGYPVIFGSARGLAAPAGTPQEIIDLLHERFKRVMFSEEHIKAAKESNTPLYYMGPEEFRRFIDNEEKDLRQALETLDL